MKKQLKNIICASIILSLLFVVSVSHVSAALETKDQATQRKNEAAKNALTWGVQATKQASKCAIGFGAKIAIGALTGLIAGLLSTNVPTVDYTKQASDALEKCISSVAKGLAKDQIVKITKSTFSWINSGLGGNPLYVSSMSNLLNSIENNVISSELSVLKDSKYAEMYPYGRNFASAQIQTQRSMGDHLSGLQSSLFDALTIDDKALSVADKLDSYANNFSQGGWNGWLSLTQNPQNNPLGFNMFEADQLDYQKEAAVTAAKDEVARGGGMLDKKECVQYGITAKGAAATTEANKALDSVEAKKEANDYLIEDTNALNDAKTNLKELQSWVATNDEDKAYKVVEIEKAKKEVDTAQSHYDASLKLVNQADAAYKYTHNTATGEECTKYETVTPGSVIKDQVSRVVTSPVVQLELVNTLDDALGSVLDSLMGKLQDAGIKNIDELFKIEKSSVPSMSLNSSGELIMGDTTSNGSRNTGGFDLKDLGNTYTEVAANAGDYTVDATTGLFKVVGANNGKYVLDKKGVIQIQTDFIALAKQNIALFGDIMPALGGLDYCIPGPNPNWEVNAQDIAIDLQSFPNQEEGQYILDLKDIYSNIMNNTYGPTSPMMNDSTNNCLVSGATNPPACNLGTTTTTTTTETLCTNGKAMADNCNDPVSNTRFNAN